MEITNNLVPFQSGTVQFALPFEDALIDDYTMTVVQTASSVDAEMGGYNLSEICDSPPFAISITNPEIQALEVFMFSVITRENEIYFWRKDSTELCDKISEYAKEIVAELERLGVNLFEDEEDE